MKIPISADTNALSIWLSVLALCLVIVLGVYSWRRRNLPGALPFSIACVFSGLWVTAIILQYAAESMATKVTMAIVQGSFALPIILAITCFFLDYAWPGRWLTRRNVILLTFLCLSYGGLVLTNDSHKLIWAGFAYEGKVIPIANPGLWLSIGIAFTATGALNLIVAGWLYKHSPHHRFPVIFFITGQVVGRTLAILEITNSFHTPLPVDVFGMAFEFLMYTFTLFGFHLLDPIPHARRTAIERLRAGLLVLDLKDRIVHVNLAAQTMLGAHARSLLGRAITELLPGYFSLPPDLGSARTAQVEFRLGSGIQAREYQLEACSLNDWRGLAVGRLLLLHDVTDQKRAQAQIIEQQRALATLHERERLARELHDSIGQVLGYINLQAQAIRKRAQGGDLPGVQAQLTRLAEVAQTAHADVRESIFSLNASAGQPRSFQARLGQFLEAYSTNYGIRTELRVPDPFDDGTFEPETEVQLLRVIQEALTNARKHGGATHVQVLVTTEVGRTRLTIADDGCGFDPDVLAQENNSHFGIRFMRERAAQVGGSLRVEAEPGKGTRVIVDVPDQVEWLQHRTTNADDSPE